MKKLLLLLILPIALHGATQELRQDTNTHKVIKPPPSVNALFDLDFSDVTTNISGGGGTGNPGGANQQVQYNNALSFGGIPYATYDGSALTLRAGARLLLADTVDISKKTIFDLSLIPTATQRTISIAPSANSMTVIPALPVTNNFVTGLSTTGILTIAQPSFSNLSGSLALSQTSMASGFMLGRSTTSQGPFEQITVGTGLTLSGGTLSASTISVPGGTDTQFQFNDSGVFNGSPYLTYNVGTGRIFEQTGTRLRFTDNADITKQMAIDLTGVGSGFARTFKIPNADFVGVIGDTGSANQFLSAISPTTGVISKAQPAFSNLSGTLGLSQTLMTTNKLIGRGTAGTGVMEEITLGTNLSLTGTTLNATGGGGTPGGSTLEMQYNNAGAFGGLSTWLVSGGGTIVTALAPSLIIADSGDPTKKMNFSTGLLTSGVTRSVVVAAGSNPVIPAADSGTANNFVTGIDTSGVIGKAQPSFSNLSGTLGLSQTSMSTARLLGRSTAGTGVIEQITVGANLTLSAGTLSASGGGTPGGSNTQLQYNNSGVFGGDFSFTSDGTSSFLRSDTTMFQDATDSTKQANFILANVPTATTRNIIVPAGANPVIVAADAGASNNFLTGITTLGVVTKAQPAFSNLSGNITMAQNKVLIGKELWVDSVNGIDPPSLNGGVRGDLSKPFLTIAAALTAASAGDIVYVGPGTYAQSTTPLVIPAGVTLVGSGADYTVITTAVLKSSNRAGVEGSTSGTLANVTIQNTASSGIPFGNGSSSAAFTTFNLSGVKLIGVSDGVSLSKTGTTGLNAENVSIQTQGQCIENAVGTSTFRASDLVADGTTTALARGIRVTAGTLVFRDGSIFASNSTTTNVAVSATGATSTAEIHNAAITRNATGTTNLDFEQSTSAVVGIDSVTRTDGTAIATSGTITELSRYQLSDPQLTSLAGLSYTGNTLKLVRVNAAETGFELATAGGGGVGDVVGPAASVDSEVALFSGTTGKLLKRSTSTGIAKLTSGVQGVATAGTDYLSPTGTETATNKRINPRVTTAASNATWAPSIATEDVFEITAQAAAVTTISNPAGTPTDNQSLVIRFKDDGTARALTWSGSQWEAGPNQTLPTTTVVGQTDWCAFRWNSTTSKWTLLANSQSAGGTLTGVTAPITNTAGVVGLDTTANLSMTALQSIKIDDATTNSTTRILNLNHNTTGTPANALGTSLGFKGEDSTTPDVDMMVISSQWSDVVDATRTAYLDLRLAAGGTPASKFRVWGSGGANLGEGTSPTDPGSGYLDVLTGLKINGVDLKDATLTWTNKRNTPRVTSIASNATWSPSADTDDVYKITAQAAAVTAINNPTGTPVDGQSLIIRMTDNATPRALTWSGSQWEAGPNLTLPTTTVASQTDYLAFKWNSTTSKWTMLANSQATSGGSVDDTAFASSWNGVTTTAPSKNAVYDELHKIDSADDGTIVNAGTGFRIGGAAASGKILIGNATNYVASTPTYPNAASTALKWLRSDGTNFITSTSTFSDTPSTALKWLRSDGTNWITSTSTLSDTPSTAGKVPISDGTNWITSTPTFPNASATSGKLIQSDGTNWVASTSTWPTSGTAQQAVISDGTNFKTDYVNGITSISGASSGINSTETVVVQTPALAANRLVAGTVIRITLIGTCTTTVANASTFNLRWGTAGTTSDGLLLSYTTAAAGTTGTNVPFRVVIEVTIRTTGASATSYGSAQLITTTTGIIGGSSVAISAPTMTNINTTTAASILSACYKTAASTTTSTFQEAYIEFVYK